MKDGCDLADSCLDCPLAKSCYDDPGGRRHSLKEMRDSEIVRQFTIERKGIEELARAFGISKRTVERALKI